jgi:maltooligosyltrehalose synthase
MARLSSPQVWGDTKLALPPELEHTQSTNLLTNESIEFGSSIDIANLFTQLPLAILVSPGK